MKQGSTILKKIDKIISVMLIVFIIVASVASLFFSYYRSQNKMIHIFGYSVCYVLTGSMEPTLNVGDVILIQEMDASNIQVQDIITYQSMSGTLSGSYITHRVIAVNNNEGIYTFVTQGDANPVPDTELITVNKVQGVYIQKLAIIKFLISILSNVWAFLIMIILPLFVALVMQLINFIFAVKSKK